MSQVIVRYKVRPGQGDVNAGFVERVFAELREKAPAGLRYGTVRLEDGVTFYHIASVETPDGSNPLLQMDAFREFQAGLQERCEEPPAPMPGTVVGSYGLFD